MSDSPTDQVFEALSALSISQSDCALIEGAEAKKLFQRFLDRFTDGVDCHWWWEKFPDLSASYHCSDNMGFERICDIVPAPHDDVYLVIEDDSRDHYPIFITKPTLAMEIIGECYSFEYYIIPKDLSWLLCENHHSVLIGVGERMKKSFSSIFGPNSTFFN